MPVRPPGDALVLIGLHFSHRTICAQPGRTFGR